MGRLSEAFKFIHVEPSKFNGLWVKENMTSLSVTPALKKVRLENLSSIRTEKKEVISKELKDRAKKVEVMDYYSAHADFDEIFQFLECQNKKKIKHIFLVHGEKEVQEHFKTKFIEHGYSCKIDIPAQGELFEI